MSDDKWSANRKRGRIDDGASNEFRADAGAGTLAGTHKMIAALQRLQQNTQMVDTSNPSLATMKISGARGMFALLSTHPPLEARIAALQNVR